MMHMEQLIERLKEQQNNRIDFYTPPGLHVYFKDEMLDDSIDVDSAVSRFESMLPQHLSSCIEMIIFGDFEEFHERSLNAFSVTTFKRKKLLRLWVHTSTHLHTYFQTLSTYC